MVLCNNSSSLLFNRHDHCFLRRHFLLLAGRVHTDVMINHAIFAVDQLLGPLLRHVDATGLLKIISDDLGIATIVSPGKDIVLETIARYLALATLRNTTNSH